MDPADVRHCLEKLAELIRRETADARTMLQLGYNLGRLSELTGGGREEFWDDWKDPATRWDRQLLANRMERLRARYGAEKNGGA